MSKEIIKLKDFYGEYLVSSHDGENLFKKVLTHTTIVVLNFEDIKVAASSFLFPFLEKIYLNDYKNKIELINLSENVKNTIDLIKDNIEKYYTNDEYKSIIDYISKTPIE